MSVKRTYDVAAYIWPAYTGTEPRAYPFWPEKNGEWQTVRQAETKFPGHAWPRRPLWGYVDEADPCVMQMEIDAAVDHALNVFIYDWYWYDRRPFLEQCLNDGFLKAKNRERMKFFLMWANHDANVTWDKRLAGADTVIWQGSVGREEFDRICDRLIQRYFKLPNYYTIDGSPVFLIYDLTNLISGLGGVRKTEKALEAFRRKAVQAGLPGIHLMAVLWGEHALNISGVDSVRDFSQKDVVKKLGFDSVSHYQYVHFANVRQDYSRVFMEVEAEWKRIDETYDVPYFPHVSIGWDNNPRFADVLDDVMTGNTPGEVKKALQSAKEFLDCHPDRVPLVTVNSWNEWTESSYLEPDDRYGYGYLEAIREVFKER